MSSHIANAATLFDHYCIQSWTDPLTDLATPYAKKVAPDGVVEQTLLGTVTLWAFSFFEYPANFMLNAPKSLQMPVYLAPIEYTVTSGILAAKRMHDVIGCSKVLSEKIDAIGEEAKELAPLHLKSGGEDFETLQGTLKEKTIEILNKQAKGQSELKWNQLLGVLSYEGLNTLGAASRAYVPYLVTSCFTDSLAAKILVPLTCYWGLSYVLNPSKREELSTRNPNHNRAKNPPSEEVESKLEIAGKLAGRTLLPYLLTSYYTDSTILAVAVPIISSAYMSYTLYSSENEKPSNKKSSQRTEVLTFNALSEIRIEAEELFQKSTDKQNKQFIEDLRAFELTYQSPGSSTPQSSDTGKGPEGGVRSIPKNKDSSSRSTSTNPSSTSENENEKKEALKKTFKALEDRAETFDKKDWHYSHYMYKAYESRMKGLESLYPDGSRVKIIYGAKRKMLFSQLNAATYREDDSHFPLLNQTLADLQNDLDNLTPKTREHKLCSNLIEIIKKEYLSKTH